MTQRIYEPITTGPGPYNMRKRIDPTARRYFVYTLSDAAGAPVYIGRSCNVAGRLRAHRSTDWISDVRDVSMVGPFTWDEACAEEFRQIRAKLPRENRTGMPKGLAS
jgi:predicted GIY-YIG superfamily endonuclease